MNDKDLGIYRSHERVLLNILDSPDLHKLYDFSNSIKRILNENDPSKAILEKLEGLYGPKALEYLHMDNTAFNPLDTLHSNQSALTNISDLSEVYSQLETDKYGNPIPLALLQREYEGSKLLHSRETLTSAQTEAIYGRKTTEMFLRMFSQEPTEPEDCDTCRTYYKSLYDDYMSHAEEDLVQYFTTLCDKMWPSLLTTTGVSVCDPNIPHECHDFCVGMVNSWGGAVAEYLGALLYDPDATCQKKQLCPVPDWDNIIPEYPRTIIPKPSTTSEISTSASDNSLDIFHLTDIHLDKNYEKGAIVNCGMPVCCHSKYGFPGDDTGAHAVGEYTCDSPLLLLESALDAVNSIKPKHLIYTGDTPAHDLWMQTRDANVELMMDVTSMTLKSCGYDAHIVQAFSNLAKDTSSITKLEKLTEIASAEVEKLQTMILDSPVTKYWPVLGNHAGAPVDQFGGPEKDAWLYGPIANAWSAFLPNETNVKATLAWGGYYAAKMEEGLYIIALQTNIYDSMNLYLKMGSHHWDMSGQLHWLDDVLDQIQANGEKAIILAHEKPGSFQTGIWAKKLLAIFTKYKNTITGIFNGHNHTDLFHVVREQLPSNSLTGLTLQQEVQLQNQEFFALKNLRSSRFALQRYETIEKLLKSSLNKLDSYDSLMSAQYKAVQNKLLNIELKKKSLWGKNIESSILLQDVVVRRLNGEKIREQYMKLRPSPSANRLLSKHSPEDTLKKLKELTFPVGVIYVAPSLTPLHYETNPSFRVILLDSKTFFPQDFINYRFDLEKGQQTGAIQWDLGYFATQQFGLSNMHPMSWLQAASQIGSSNEEWEKFKVLYHGGIIGHNDDPNDHIFLSPVSAMCFVATSIKEEYEECMAAFST